METDRYNISVQTLIERYDGSLYADLGTMKWFGVDEEVRAWLSASCKKTAFWLIGFDKVTSGEAYTLLYRTKVDHLNGEPVSDTGLIEFDAMSYEDVVRFERWAVEQLAELIDMLQAKHIRGPVQTKRRSKLRELIKFVTDGAAHRFSFFKQK